MILKVRTFLENLMETKRNTITLAELMEFPGWEPKFWKFNKANLTLECEYYEIDLERCNSPAEILDWIFQVKNKGWITPELMDDLLTAFEHACDEVFDNNIQGLFCPFGEGRVANWKTGKRIK